MSSRFRILLIKPTHYDGEGYPISWVRSMIPSNTLAVMYGLVSDCAARQVLGDVEFDVECIDETNTVVRTGPLIARMAREGVPTVVMLVGVQTNQFPRAMDIARPLRRAGIPVMIGGFHVSGCLSMLPEPTPELREAWELGISLYAGEAEEGRLDAVLRDGWAGSLKPLYDHLNDLPSIENAPLPILPAAAIGRIHGAWSSFDLGRGCPYQCSFCTIINVQGRKSRFRTADDLEAIIRANKAQGIQAFFITDDNLARNHDWESFFDRLIDLREQGLRANLTIQVDTLCHKTPRFIEKAVAAGVNRVFIGLENINPDNLGAAGKRQNRITEYRAMLREWLDRGVFTFAGYIIGFPGDTPASVLRDVEIIKRELPIDVLEFFYLTPLPGSADHAALAQAGTWMEPDLNRYDLYHRCSHHPGMTDHEWEQTYRAAWDSWFSWDHIETIARRRAAVHVGQNGRPLDYMVAKVAGYLTEFRAIYMIEGVHPLEGGIARRKTRRERRAGMMRWPAVLFYPLLGVEYAVKAVRYASEYLHMRAVIRRVLADPAPSAYTDAALARDADDELALYRETRGGEGAVELARVRAERIEKVHAAV